LWVPSQNGLLPECLHPRSHTFWHSPFSCFVGSSPVPLCEPSQDGRFFERPQAHQQQVPGSSVISNDPFWAIAASVMGSLLDSPDRLD
jgi:hypothetical protein